MSHIAPYALGLDLTEHLGLPNTNVMPSDINNPRLTRRWLLGAGAVTIAGVTGLSGCTGQATSEPGGSTATDSDEREVTHALGRTTVPAQPQRVIAVDELSALAVSTLR